MLCQIGNGNPNVDKTLVLALDDQVAQLTRKAGLNVWECLSCGKTASKRTDLKKHIEAHHLNLCLPCEMCGSTFNSRHVRQSHMRTIHQIFLK